jgi:MscS family membrane protein
MIHDWLRHILPQTLFNIGPRGLMWWQWLAFPALVLISWLVGHALGIVTRGLLHRLSRRTSATWDDRLFDRTSAGIGLLWGLLLFRLLLPNLELNPTSLGNVHKVLGVFVVIVTFWMIWRSVDVLIRGMFERPWAVGNPSALSLLSVGGNLARGAVVLIGVVTAIAAMGYPVATVVAGLGIGGIAIAFGAQKTVENLFGSVALAIDQPCRVGDTVKVDDVTGVVERIGSRSTQIRTVERTLVTIPNGKLSDLRIESFAMRDRIKFATTVKLFYDTTEPQLKRVLDGLEQVLRSHRKIWPDLVLVRFAGFGDSSIDIEVLCWFQTTDYDRFRDYRQDVLLGFMRVVADSGASFAFPAPVHLIRHKSGGEAARAPQPERGSTA